VLARVDLAVATEESIAARSGCDTLRHIEMKTVSIRDLHARTGALVREAARRPLLITDRGRLLAVIQAPTALLKQGVALPNREAFIAKLPKQKSDSAALVGDDRDR
jgi:antitoxin (DNA-binding transcriptional repressor) of toxin-antitoxin stability system